MKGPYFMLRSGTQAGCGVRVEAGVGVGGSRPILPGVGVGAGVCKILPTPTPARSRRIPTVNWQ